MIEQRRIIQIGFNRCGTTTLHNFFTDNGLPSVHWQQGELAQRIAARMRASEDPFKDYPETVAFSDMTHLTDRVFLEPFKNFEAMHRCYPNAYFILNTRNCDDWIESRVKHNFVARCQAVLQLPDEASVRLRWMRDWYVHHARTLSYFAVGTGRLLVYDIDRDKPEKLCAFLAADWKLDPTFWGHANLTPLVGAGESNAPARVATIKADSSGIAIKATVVGKETPNEINAGHEDRRYWVAVLQRLAAPLLGALADGELKKQMPVEALNPSERSKYTHLEGFARLLSGIAPWLGANGLDSCEAAIQGRFAELARTSLDAATNPQSPDFMNFNQGMQPLVDVAFMAQGILRAPNVLWQTLDPRVRMQVVAALKASRSISTPTSNNWVMFSAIIEAALLEMGEKTVEARLEGSLRKMLSWYKGDGVYGDGAWFHFDAYNSFVIQPMLLEVLQVLSRRDARFEPGYRVVLERARRYAEIQERSVAPDGTFPCVGRSAAYRFGAFHLLGKLSLMRELSAALKPAQVRCSLTAVIRNTIEVPETFDQQGWLRPGFCGYQPSLAEAYISTGSLYLCSNVLLPLGLPPTDAFWHDEPMPWTSQRIWGGEQLPADYPLQFEKHVLIPALSQDGEM